MFDTTKAFSSFSVDDLPRARQFYADTLGLNVTEDARMGFLTLVLASGARVMVYPKGKAHSPASYTALNFPVADIGKTVDELVARGVRFERYDGIAVDDRGISRGNGPAIAWFKDPAGNVFSVIQEG